MKRFAILASMIVLIGSGCAASQVPAAPAEAPMPPVVAPMHPNLRNLSILPNNLVASPLTITGEAKLWYFEASFPIHLLDGNGNELAVVPAQAQSDWMTEEFVPFEAKLTFAQPTTATGTLVLKKDNPSGEPERDEEWRIPVRFVAATPPALE